MAHQYSVAIQNGQLDQVEVVTGASAKLQIRTGAPPANCAAADSGTLIVEIPLPSDWMAAASTSAKVKAGTWQANASGAGTLTAGHYRIKDNAGSTTHVQGTAGQNVVISTNALTSANGNVLNFASTTGVVVGMNVSGTGVVSGATVVALTSTTVTLSHTSTAGVASAASITFSYDLPLDNASIANGQLVTVGTYTLNANNQ